MDTLAGGWGDARLPEMTARFGHPLNDACEYASQCVVGALQNAESEVERLTAENAALRAAQPDVEKIARAIHRRLRIGTGIDVAGAKDRIADELRRQLSGGKV